MKQLVCRAFAHGKERSKVIEVIDFAHVTDTT
jgi:hypothetical protein